LQWLFHDDGSTVNIDFYTFMYVIWLLTPASADDVAKFLLGFAMRCSGRIPYTDMYDMLRNMEPPVGFGKKCPYRLAYRVSIFFSGAL